MNWRPSVKCPPLPFPSHRWQTTITKALTCRAMLQLVDAVALARDLKHGAGLPGWNWTGWFVAIMDQHGHTVDEVPIVDV